MNMPFLTMQALLGTDKRPPELPADDSEPGRLTQAIAATRDGSENAEALRLLRAAGVQAVCGLAGYRPPRADSALPEPCPPEPRASVDKAAVIDVLRQVLSSGSDRMRLEAFRLMLGAGKVLPPALLPQALELGRRTPSLRGPIALIAGERGRWLGGRNAAWNLFATNAENELAPEVWDNGTLMQREAYLKSLRAQDPAKARERFETASASFDARERAAFTGCLGEGLSAADEAFLETLLEKDRSKEVRQAAASLLVRLPESGYVRRMGERLAACIVVPEARGGLIGRIASAFSAPLPAVEPPESFDPEWKKDLLEEKKPQYEEFGPRAWWLYQIGRCVPLAWWACRPKPSSTGRRKPTGETCCSAAGWRPPAVSAMRHGPPPCSPMCSRNRLRFPWARAGSAPSHSSAFCRPPSVRRPFLNASPAPAPRAAGPRSHSNTINR